MLCKVQFLKHVVNVFGLRILFIMFFRSGECIDSGMLGAVHRLELLKEFLTSPFLNPALLFSTLLFFMTELHIMFENTSFHQGTLDYKGVTRALLELHRCPCLLF